MVIKGSKAGEPRKDPFNETIIWDIDPKKTALIVIDMQNCFCSPGGLVEVPLARRIVPNINKLTDGCRKSDIPVIWVNWGLRTDGSDSGLIWNFFAHQGENLVSHTMGVGIDTKGQQIYPELKTEESDYFVIKRRFSALIDGSSELERMLRTMERDTIIITGTTTDTCCESTARDAMMLDFKVIVISDGTATFTEDLHQATLARLRFQWAMVCNTDELIEEIQKT
jgi:ureidoacrylate peracid hydrolase